MALPVSALFFILPITMTFIIAYLFTMLAIVMFCAGSLYLFSNPKTYPWFAAFPKTIWQYLIAQLTLSAVFVIREVIFETTTPIGLFLFLHIALLAFFAILLMLLKGGKEIIEAKDAEIKQKTSVLKMLQLDVETAMRQNPQYEQPLKKVAEALKYSDPMSHPAVAVYEEQIQRNIFLLTTSTDNDPTNITEICETLLKQIADRNSRVKMLK
jgi:hypothetical protein